MSQEAQVQKAPVEVKKEPEKQVPLIVVYYNQLASFKQQKEQAQIQFQQLTGCIFACEQMIKQYEESAKQAAMAMVPNGNQGEIKDGKIDKRKKKQVA